MNYKNAKQILPGELISEIQKYADGCLLYIPSKTGEKKSWGALNGTRQRYEERNKEIRRLYENNTSVLQLSRMYYLSCDSIKKIVRRRV